MVYRQQYTQNQAQMRKNMIEQFKLTDLKTTYPLSIILGDVNGLKMVNDV